MRVNPCELRTDFTDIEAIPCAGYRHIDPKKIEKKKKGNRGLKIPTVKPQFPPALCVLCRAEASPHDRYGYGYMNEEEANLITLVRQTNKLGAVTQFLKKDIKDKRSDASIGRELEEDTPIFNPKDSTNGIEELYIEDEDKSEHSGSNMSMMDEREDEF